MPTRYWRRNLATLWVAQMLNMMAFTFFFPFIPLYIQTLDVRGAVEAAQWAGAISAIPSLTMAISQPFWGRMADRFGRKPMVIRSMVANSITTLLMAFATSAGQLLALRTAQGLVTGTIAATTVLVATCTPKERLGFALGLLQVAVFVGASIGPLAGGLIADSFGYRPAFFLSAAQMVVGMIVVVVFTREEFTPPKAEAQHTSFWVESKSILSIGLVPLLLGVIFLTQFGNTTVGPLLSLYVAELAGNENAATAAGIIFGVTGAVSAASALGVGRIGDRIGHRVVLPVCLLGTAISYFPQAFVQQVWQLLLLRIATGAFLGGLMPSANALVASLIPRQRRGAAFGLTSSATSLSNFAGPIFGAGIATTFGMREVFLATGAIFAAAYGWAMLGFRRDDTPEGKA